MLVTVMLFGSELVGEPNEIKFKIFYRFLQSQVQKADYLPLTLCLLRLKTFDDRALRDRWMWVGE